MLLCMSYREGGKVGKRTLSKFIELPPEMAEKIRAVIREAVLADSPGGTPPRSARSASSAFLRRFGVRFVCFRGRFVGFGGIGFQRSGCWMHPIFLVGRDAAGRKPKPMPRSPTNAASKLTVGPKSSIGGIAAL